MKRSTRIISYFAIFTAVFLFGWAAAVVTNQVAESEIISDIISNPDPVQKEFNARAEAEGVELDTFWLVKEILEKKYVEDDEIDGDSVVYGATKGLTETLEDPYTVFMTPDETQEFNDNLNGDLEGIGAELTVRDQVLMVVSPLKNSPAKEAGLLPDDIIYKIDDEVAAEMSLFDAIHAIRGEKGTEVVLTIIREGVEQPFDLTIERDQVEVASVEHEELQDGIWLVTVNQFSDDTKMEFDQVINEIKLAEGRGIVLDLRYNGGGYLAGSVDIMSAFIRDAKEIVTIKYRDPQLNQTYFTDGKAQLPDIPLVVLVNRGSASASEIVAAAVQDLERGLVIGEKTFGKGSVQEVNPLPDGSSLRLTVAKWYSPDGSNIDHVGLEPDRTVELTEEDYQAARDPQVDAAVEYLNSIQ
ncbi:PDZ domain-containing protein [Candidatus Peregrinibacteria bacterium]|nr:PDZ domain-containing protein [Candidatus Peregrinibacteria bacterium]